MRLKIFRAATTAEAMARVRSELGVDALILGTRKVSDGVEVTAALEPAVPPTPAPPDPARVGLLQYHAVPAELHPALDRCALPDALARAVPFAALSLENDSAPILLAGPPGAGKTLTTARLATRLVLAGTTPLVITADGRRAGATEQLAAFTRLLGINLVVASHPVTLSRAVTRRQNGAPVLIDAAGSDPFDPAQSDELRALAAASGSVIALVLPAGMDPAEAADVACAYAAAGAAMLIVTKLDLTRRLGSLMAAAAAARLPLAEAGIGAGAADGMVPFTPALLADRLMKIGKLSHERHVA